jgi:hypothetical protein
MSGDKVMKPPSRVNEYANSLRGLQAVCLAALLIPLLITALIYAQAAPGKLILKTVDDKLITDTVTVPNAEQGLVLKLANQAGDISPLDPNKVTFVPDDDFFKAELVSGQSNQIKLTPKNIKYAATEIKKEVSLTYTVSPGSPISSDKITFAIQPNVEVTVTVAGKNIASGETFFITEDTTKAYTVAIKSLKNEGALPKAKLISEPAGMITETDTGLKASPLLATSGDQKVAIHAAILESSGDEAVLGFEITAMVLQKAESIEFDNQVSSLDEGTSVTVQAQLKSKGKTTLSVFENRKIEPVVSDQHRKYVEVERIDGNKFKITAKLINDEAQSKPPEPPKTESSSPVASPPNSNRVAPPPTQRPSPEVKQPATAPRKKQPSGTMKPATDQTTRARTTSTATSGEPSPAPAAPGDAAPPAAPATQPATDSDSQTSLTGKNVAIDFTIVQEGVPTVTGKFVLKLLIEPTLGYITFTPPPVAFLLPNGNITTIAQVRDQDGKVTGNPVTFRLEDEKENAKWVVISQEGNQLNVYWNEPDESELKKADGTLKKRPSQVVVLANSHIGEHKIQSKVFIRMGDIAKFAPLKVKLNIMDQRTAKDLYGGVTSDEYYVLTVRLFNNLKDEDTKQYFGSSILAYSASVEVAVGLEKKFNAKLNSDPTGVISKEKSQGLKNQRAQRVDEMSKDQAVEDKKTITEYQKQINGAVKAQRETESEAAKRESQYQEEKLKFALGNSTEPQVKAALQAAESARIAANASLDQLIGLQSQIARSAEARAYAFKQLLDYTDWGLTVDDGKWHPMRRGDLYKIAPNIKSYPLPDRRVISETKPDDEPLCTGVVKYRPFSFEMMVNTVDRRDERGIRSKIFLLLNGLGTATSFFTAVLQPPKSNSTPLVLEKYSNLLLPAIDKLFPSLKEQQRQNIVSQAMKTIEEIPFGSDITRVLFIPKREIRGLLSGHDVRISEVCPFYFSIEVAIVKKGGVVKTGGATP